MFIPQFCSAVWKWWIDAAELAGIVSDSTDKGIKWTAPRKFMIDPTSETKALKDQVRSGFTTLSQAVRELGEDPVAHFDEMAADNSTLDRLELVLDTDPRKITQAGMKQSDAVSTQDPAEASGEVSNDSQKRNLKIAK